MELGEKLRQARQEKGLSQRQLCGDTITRNMLSLIENGAAAPSLETLQFLASRLEKPIGYFLGEASVTSPNQAVIQEVRLCLEEGALTTALEQLRRYQAPDPVFDQEAALLEVLVCIGLAEEMISRNKKPYAEELLQRAKLAGEKTVYYTRELERRRLLALAQIMLVFLPADDLELLLRAEAALSQGDLLRAQQYLEAGEEKEAPHWQYLMGSVYQQRGAYEEAANCYRMAWDYAPMACCQRLEVCCREMGDYKQAYRYACLIREMNL